MTSQEQEELVGLVSALEEAAARLPAESSWRGRFLREARLLGAAAQLQTFGSARDGSRPSRSGLTLVKSDHVEGAI